MMCDNDMAAQAKMQLAQSRFAMVDAVMFLDTHPDDASALEYYRRKQQKLMQAMENYSQNVGPVDAHSVDVSCGRWTWVDDPWPWQL